MFSALEPSDVIAIYFSFILIACPSSSKIINPQYFRLIWLGVVTMRYFRHWCSSCRCRRCSTLDAATVDDSIVSLLLPTWVATALVKFCTRTLWLIQHMHSLLFIRLWRASRYLGCGKAERDYRGGKCQVQVWWYAQAGNCDMRRYNATEGVN